MTIGFMTTIKKEQRKGDNYNMSQITLLPNMQRAIKDKKTNNPTEIWAKTRSSQKKYINSA